MKGVYALCIENDHPEAIGEPRRYVLNWRTGAQWYYGPTALAKPHRQSYSRQDAAAVCEWLNGRENIAEALEVLVNART